MKMSNIDDIIYNDIIHDGLDEFMLEFEPFKAKEIEEVRNRYENIYAAYEEYIKNVLHEKVLYINTTYNLSITVDELLTYKKQLVEVKKIDKCASSQCNNICGYNNNGFCRECKNVDN